MKVGNQAPKVNRHLKGDSPSKKRYNKSSLVKSMTIGAEKMLYDDPDYDENMEDEPE